MIAGATCACALSGCCELVASPGYAALLRKYSERKTRRQSVFRLPLSSSLTTKELLACHPPKRRGTLDQLILLSFFGRSGLSEYSCAATVRKPVARLTSRLTAIFCIMPPLYCGKDGREE